MNEPFVLMFAGPNGAGKTTLAKSLLRRGIDLGEYINPDDIALELEGTLAARSARAQEIADQRRSDCIRQKRSFSFETVMSHPSKVDVLVQAKEAGFFVQLFFIGIDDPATSVDRVALRVAQGGHDVPENKIRERWLRTMNLLSKAIRASDKSFIFDNSIAGLIETVPRLVFQRSVVKASHLPQSEMIGLPPTWVQRFVLDPLGIGLFEGYSRFRHKTAVGSIVTLPVHPEIGPTIERQRAEEPEPSPAASQGAGLDRFSKALVDAVDFAAQAYSREGFGIQTGLRDLDRHIGGLQSSEFIVLGSRHGLGKTALATNIAHNVAKSWRGEVRADESVATTAGGIVGFFSLEMSAEQIATRVISQQSRIPTNLIRRGGISEKDFEIIRSLASEFQRMPFYIDETGTLSIEQLVARAHRLKEQKGLDLLVIDSLDILRNVASLSGNARPDSFEITRQLKQLAKNLNIPVLALTQLASKGSQIRDQRPRLEDIQDDGAIEEDADLVLLLHREDFHLLRSEPRPGTYEHMKWQTEIELVLGQAELIIAKRRNGPTGTIRLAFDSSVGLFSDVEYSQS